MDLTSPSQIETWEACARKGALKYVARIETAQNASAALGTEIDDTQLQPLLRDGRPLDQTRPSGQIAQSITQWLPPPGSCGKNGIGEVQRHFEISSPTWIDGKHCGLGLQGYTDLWLPDGGLELPDGVPTTVDGIVPPVVVDFKSTKNFKWAKTADQLRTDVQAQSYAFWALYETRRPVVDLVWLYMRTEGARQGKRVHLRVHAADAAREFVSIDERARQVYALKQSVTDPMLVPPNPEHCEAYGGCPYREKCNLGPGEIADALAAKAKRRREPMTMNATNPTTGLLARLKAQREGGAVATTTTTAAPAPQPPAAAPPPEAPPAATPGQAAANALTTALSAAPAAIGINPPESLLPPAPPVGIASTTTAEPAKRGPGRPRKTSEAVDLDIAVNGGERVRAVWAREKISPVAYNDFEVGPFEAEGFTKPGESIGQAQERIYAELTAFAEIARAKKADSYASTLTSMGVKS